MQQRNPWLWGVPMSEMEPTPEPTPEPEPEPEPKSDEVTPSADGAKPWDTMTTHAQIDAWADQQGFSRGEDWGRMNLAAKRLWLVDYFDGAEPWNDA
jgi:hypothetical protein